MRRRKHIRLREYDYSQPGAYFITVCVKDRDEMFGEIVDGEMKRNACGNSVQSCWEEWPTHFENIQPDEFIVMPNHIHGIIILDQLGRDVQLNIPTGHYHSRISPRSGSLSVIVRTFKAAVTTEYRKKGYTDFCWQSRFYDHIIHSEKSLNRIRGYIRTNPQQWAWDRENAKCNGMDEFDRWLNEEGRHKIPKGRDS